MKTEQELLDDETERERLIKTDPKNYDELNQRYANLQNTKSDYDEYERHSVISDADDNRENEEKRLRDEEMLNKIDDNFTLSNFPYRVYKNYYIGLDEEEYQFDPEDRDFFVNVVEFAVDNPNITDYLEERDRETYDIKPNEKSSPASQLDDMILERKKQTLSELSSVRKTRQSSEQPTALTYAIRKHADKTKRKIALEKATLDAKKKIIADYETTTETYNDKTAAYQASLDNAFLTKPFVWALSAPKQGIRNIIEAFRVWRKNKLEKITDDRLEQFNAEVDREGHKMLKSLKIILDKEPNIDPNTKEAYLKEVKEACNISDPVAPKELAERRMNNARSFNEDLKGMGQKAKQKEEVLITAKKVSTNKSMLQERAKKRESSNDRDDRSSTRSSRSAEPAKRTWRANDTRSELSYASSASSAGKTTQEIANKNAGRLRSYTNITDKQDPKDMTMRQAPKITGRVEDRKITDRT